MCKVTRVLPLLSCFGITLQQISVHKPGKGVKEVSRSSTLPYTGVWNQCQKVANQWPLLVDLGCHEDHFRNEFLPSRIGSLIVVDWSFSSDSQWSIMAKFWTWSIIDYHCQMIKKCNAYEPTMQNAQVTFQGSTIYRMLHYTVILYHDRQSMAMNQFG